MKLSYLRIINFKSCNNVSLSLENLHAMVGANNSGKSTILNALDFFFNPSTRKINEESFWNLNTKNPIRIEGVFTDLKAAEIEALGAYLKPDNSFHMARTAKLDSTIPSGGSSGDTANSAVVIEQHYCKPQPKEEWLRDSEISGENIKRWWKDRDKLIIKNFSFSKFLDATVQPQVGHWKAKAKEFVQTYAEELELEDIWINNPKGYAGVLKASLPVFVFVPAVRDVIDESKVTKSNPFGTLLYAMLESVSDDHKDAINQILHDMSKKFNRIGGKNRIDLITKIEGELNNLLGEFFTECDLEIEFQTPTLELMFTSPKIFIDDGFRNIVENKGHGLQRAVIFTILRRYAQFISSENIEKKRTLIFGIEEPELYMHPQAQRTSRKVFKRLADGGDQVLFTTHSPLLVDVAFFDEIIRLESTIITEEKKKTVISQARQLLMGQLIEDETKRHRHLTDKVTDQSMRDRYSHVYNPARNEGFFAKKIILVEGSTEEYSLPIYAEAIDGCSFDERGISIVECGGKGWIDRLYRIFNELGIACFILFDYDKDNSKRSTIEQSEQLLSLVGEDSGVPDSLFLCSKAACFPNKWEVDLRDEIENYDELVAEARDVLGVGNDTGKPLIARYIARKLVNQSPPIIPSSLEKIIKTAINVEWSNSCLII